MAKWNEHRQAVLELLKKQRKSTYWLHQQLSDKYSKSLIYGYLAGDSDISMDTMHAINRVLGIRFTDE